jgi:hypothetical protein
VISSEQAVLLQLAGRLLNAERSKTPKQRKMKDAARAGWLRGCTQGYGWFIQPYISQSGVRRQVFAAGVDSGGVTVSTGSLAARRHAGVWAPAIARKTKVANDNLALAA